MTAQLATIERKPTAMGLTPQTIGEAIELANLMSKSGIVPKDYQGNPGNIIVAIQWGAEIGLPPLQAMQNLAVINGRPALWGDAVIALVRGSGLLESIEEDMTDTSATCTVKRKGEPAVSRTFAMEDAKRAGLSGKQGPWTQYPKRMLQMRARAWALRDVFPDVLRGVHVAEEAQDMPAERDMGEAQRVEAPSASRTEAIKAKLVTRHSTSIADVLAAISAANGEGELKVAAAKAKHLDSEEHKQEARAAYQRRAADIKAQQLADSLVEACRNSKSQDERDQILDAARDLPEEQRHRVVEAVGDYS